MTSTLILLVILFILTLLWLDGARARELAIAISKAACKRQGWQLLDDTVFMQRIGLRWTSKGLRFRRMFRFEYSADGAQRENGYVLMIGTELELIHIQEKPGEM